jgi:hypothetical protein
MPRLQTSNKTRLPVRGCLTCLDKELSVADLPACSSRRVKDHAAAAAADETEMVLPSALCCFSISINHTLTHTVYTYAHLLNNRLCLASQEGHSSLIQRTTFILPHLFGPFSRPTSLSIVDFTFYTLSEDIIRQAPYSSTCPQRPCSPHIYPPSVFFAWPFLQQPVVPTRLLALSLQLLLTEARPRRIHSFEDKRHATRLSRGGMRNLKRKSKIPAYR